MRRALVPRVNRRPAARIAASSASWVPGGTRGGVLAGTHPQRACQPAGSSQACQRGNSRISRGTSGSRSLLPASMAPRRPSSLPSAPLIKTVGPPGIVTVHSWGAHATPARASQVPSHWTPYAECSWCHRRTPASALRTPDCLGGLGPVGGAELAQDLGHVLLTVSSGTTRLRAMRWVDRPAAPACGRRSGRLSRAAPGPLSSTCWLPSERPPAWPPCCNFTRSVAGFLIDMGVDLARRAAHDAARNGPAGRTGAVTGHAGQAPRQAPPGGQARDRAWPPGPAPPAHR